MPISATDLNKAYLAYFGRPADLTGKTYFATLEQADVIKAFDASAESKALYGNDAAAKVNAIYQNLFNRDAEPEGLVYWTTLINQGRVTAAGAAFAILNGALGTDATAVQNKLAASEAFVAAMDTTPELVGYSGMDAAASARNWLKAVGADAASLTAAVAGAQAAVTAAVEAGTGEGGAGYQLTNGTDVASSNVFTAGLVYTPGGDDRINSLQDEDRLTGTGPNATLNATLGNANDNGGTTIAPTLKGIESLNVAFTGAGNANTVSNNAVNTLDLQDATGVKNINVTRISDGAGANQVSFVNIVDNGTNNLSIDNVSVPTRVNFDYQDAALAGKADTGTLTLKGVNLNQVSISNNAQAPGVSLAGFETLNLVSTDTANTLRLLSATQLNALVISGDKALTLANQTTQAERVVVNAPSIANDGAGNYVLGTIDASALGAALTIDLTNHVGAQTSPEASGKVSYLSVTGTASADTFIINQATVDSGLAIAGGDGKDTLKLYANLTDVAATAPRAAITSVENLEVRSQGNNIAVDTSLISNLETILVRNEDFAAAHNFNLNNLSAAAASGINVHHAVTGSTGLAQTVVNAQIKDASGTNDTVAVNLVTDLNQDVRFNLTLNATGANQGQNSVENITINDNDNESNSVSLTSFAQHTGTITATGGQAGQFLNLDANVAGNGYGIDTAGTAVDRTTQVAGAFTANPFVLTQVSARDAAVGSVFNTAPGGELLVAKNITASAYAGDFIARVGAANQNIQLGAGNDTIVFADRAGITATTAGLTISDTVAGGAGTDTLVFDGAGAQNLGASEWTNLTGVDVLRLAGQAGSNFNIQVTNQLVDQSDAGDRITIVNNNGDLRNANEQTATIDLTSLNATNFVTFIGANGDGSAAHVGRAVQTVVLNDVTANGNSVLNGGSRDVVTNWADIGAGRPFATQAAADAAYNGQVAAAQVGNNNVYSVVSQGTNAQVTVGDLANTSNFSTVQWTNTDAVSRTLFLTLDNATVDRLVDANHAANNVATETLRVLSSDSTTVVGATAVLNITGGSLSNAFNLNVLASRGTDNITTGAGADTVVMLGNFAAGVYGVDAATGVNVNQFANGVVPALVVTDTVNMGAGNDTLVTYGAINLAGAVLTGVEVLVANSDVILTQDQYNALTTIRFDGGTNHTLTIIDSAGGLPIDLSKIVDNTGGTITVTNNAVEGSIGVPPAGVIVMGAVVDVAGAALLPAGSYSLNDSAANLAGAAAAILNGAIDITANTAATVAQANTIDAATNAGVNTYSVTDSAGNLLGTPLAGAATAVTVTGNAAGALTEAQHATLTGITTDDSWTFSITDSAANLLDGTIAGATAVTVIGNAAGVLTEAQHATLTGITTDDSWSFSITDTAANLLDGTIAGATAVAVTGNAAGVLTEAQHATLAGITTVGGWSFSITDTAANLLDGTIAGATAVAVTGNAAGVLTEAQHATLAGITTVGGWTFSITDTAANLLDGTIAGATAVTVTGNAAGSLTVAQYGTLTGITTDDTFSYSLTGDGAAFAGAALATITGATANTVVLADDETGLVINGLGTGDTLNVAADNTVALDTVVASAADVNANGEWNFSAGVLTWFDGAATHSIGLVGVTNVVLGAGDVFTLIG